VVTIAQLHNLFTWQGHLQADHDKHKQDTSGCIEELAAKVKTDVSACRDKLERDVSAVHDDVAAKCKAVESMCQVSPSNARLQALARITRVIKRRQIARK
jgi:hypothetical protein